MPPGKTPKPVPKTLHEAKRQGLSRNQIAALPKSPSMGRNLKNTINKNRSQSAKDNPGNSSKRPR